MHMHHHLKEADRTHDDVTTGYLQQVEDRKKVAKDCVNRFEHLGKSINSHVQVLEALANDLKRLNNEAATASAAQYSNAAATLRNEFDRMQPVINAETQRLNNYIDNCKAVEKARQDWKKKKDEYDMTRKKVHKLHEKPATKEKEQAKLQQKEAKLSSEDREFHDANRFLQTMALDNVNMGNTIITDAANTVASALSRNYSAITHSFQDAQPTALAKQASLHTAAMPLESRVG